MKKMYVVGSDLAKEQFKQHFVLSRFKPNFVVVVGGHGTLFKSEKRYPGVPKLFLHHVSPDKKLVNDIAQKIKNKQFFIAELPKLTINVGNHKASALNDVNIQCRHPQAIRYQVFADEKPLFVDNNGSAKTIIGDGVVIATPYGSSAYFKSITRNTFSKGIGIAPNNPMDELNHVIIPSNSKVEIKIMRGPGSLFYDSEKKGIKLDSNYSIKIKAGDLNAKLIQLK